MNLERGWGLAGLSLMAGMGLFLAWRVQPSPQSRPQPPIAQPSELLYQTFARSGSVIHTLTIPPAAPYTLKPFIADSVLTVPQIAARTRAVAVLNAGFFDPVNQQSTSRIVLDGQEKAHPEANARLMQNPQLAPYLPAILNRSEVRIYHCRSWVQVAIALRFTAPMEGCTLHHAMGGGPQLLPQDTSQQEGFTAYAEGRMIRDAIGGTQPNARTAIALKAEGTVVWVMVAQKSSGQRPGGLTLAELADFLKTLGATAALNLDGGTSSALYYQGQTIEGKQGDHGQTLARPIKSALLLTASDP